MFLNYVKYSWRSLVRNRSWSLLNIAGLTAGLLCFAYIALWVMDELSYDKFNGNYNRIVRLVETAKTETGITEAAVSSAPMAKALLQDYAEVENTVRFRLREEIISHDNQQTLQPGILLTDPSFFKVFNYHLTKGNVATALNEPYSIILTTSTAKKYFGANDPVGQALTINLYDTGSGAIYKITGIMPDPPQNSHIRFNILVSFKTAEVANPDILTVDGWGDAGFYTYLLLKKGVDAGRFSRKITHFYEKYIADRFAVWSKIYFYKLQPLKDIHLNSHLQYDISPPGSMAQVYIFSTIGIFILLLAAINYINLATAQAVNKAKATGIKKVVGAFRGQLIIQYLFESVTLTLVAFIVSLVLCYLLKPVFYQLTGKDLSLFAYPQLLLLLTGLCVMLGLLSGAYPAFIIAGYRPVVVLKGSFKSGERGILLRKVLVVSQFTITILLISGIIIIDSQLSYMKTKDLGYNNNSLLFLRVHGNSDVINGYPAFKNELLASPVITSATVSNSLLGSLASGGAETIDEKHNVLRVNTARLRVDSSYLKVYGIKLLAGNNFNWAGSGDSIRPVIVNESAINKFGWHSAATAIGKPFKMGDQQGRVIGVVKNFHFSPLQQLITPLAIYPVDRRFSRITLKTTMSKNTTVTGWIEKIWKKHFPSALLDYDFSENQFATQYSSDERFAKIFFSFSVLSLLIACLGLYGLIAFTISQKTKEIGIRKVLGAKAYSIAVLLSAGFLKLVGLALLLATPVTWYVMDKWLENFAYRINIGGWMFFAGGLLVTLVALMTVGSKAIIAALVNPVKSLRTE